MLNTAKQTIKRLWAAAPIATSILALALVATLFFGTRSFLHWYDRPPLMEREQPVAAWMTPRYVSHAWGVPMHVIRDAIGRPEPGQKGPTSLTQIAEERGVSVEQLLEEVQTAIIVFREAHEPPKPPKPKDAAQSPAEESQAKESQAND